MRVLQESPTAVKEEKRGCRDCGAGGRGKEICWSEREEKGARCETVGSLWEFVIVRSSAQGRGEEEANGGLWVRIGMRQGRGEILRNRMSQWQYKQAHTPYRRA